MYYRKQNILLSKQDIDSINDIIQFKKKGIYYNTGRTCYYKLTYPVSFDGREYGYMKIKGSGFGGENGVYQKPSASPFIRTDPHFAIDQHGNGYFEYSPDAPFGGMTLERALNEYDNFSHLYKNGVSTLLPFAVISNEYTFNEKPMAASLSLCPNNKPYRFDILLKKEKEQDYVSFYKEIAQRNNISTFNNQWEDSLINWVAYHYAATIRQFNDIGLCIYSGGWSNIQYASEINKVVLIDLDSSRLYNHDRVTLMRTTRDLISNLYRFFINLYNPQSIVAFSQERIRTSNYTLSFLNGYYHSYKDSKITIAANNINSFFINECFNRIKALEKQGLMDSVSETEVKQYELDIYSFYDYCMRQLYPITLSRAGNRSYYLPEYI